MKVKRFVACILAAVFMLGAFALMGCTDKDKPRVLTDAEKSIVGTWASAYEPERYKIIFHDDGTYYFIEYNKDGTERSRHTRTFEQTGEGYEAERGHYYIILVSVDHILFDSDPNNLYQTPIGSDKVSEYPSMIRVTA